MLGCDIMSFHSMKYPQETGWKHWQGDIDPLISRSDNVFTVDGCIMT